MKEKKKKKKGVKELASIAVSTLCPKPPYTKYIDLRPAEPSSFKGVGLADVLVMHALA